MFNFYNSFTGEGLNHFTDEKTDYQAQSNLFQLMAELKCKFRFIRIHAL